MLATKDGTRVAAWCFGAALREPNTLITAVCEWPVSNHLVVSMTTGPSQGTGTVCLFDITKNQVVKAFEVPFEVGKWVH